MLSNIRFSLKQLADLDTDFAASKKSLPIVIQKILRDKLRQIRAELRAGIPRKAGALARSFGYSVKRRQGIAIGRLGFFSGKKIPASAVIAANVLQRPGAEARKGKWMWIPIGTNRMGNGMAAMPPRELLASGGFVRQSKSGNVIAFQRQEDGSVIPMFVLKRSVVFRQPPIPFEDRMDKAAPEIAEEIPEFVRQVIEARRAAIAATINN